MELFKNSLKSISIHESKLIIEKKFTRKTDIFELTSISKIFIKRKRIRSFYFFDIISFVVLLLSIVTFNYVSIYSFFFLLVLFVFWTMHLIYFKSFYMHVKLNNGHSINYYFSNENKYEVLENVKIVRGNLISFNFSQ
jgi:c-di-AMP phosphodiesterase-like protein